MELKNGFILRNFPIRGKARGCFRREKEQMKVKGINWTQNLRKCSVKSILPPLIWLNIHLANKQSKQWGKKLVTISDQIKMNHQMTLNCKTGKSRLILQSCVWLVMKSHLLYCLPQYPSFPFSALVSYKSYGPVLTVDTSVLKSEQWQRGVNENIPSLPLLSLACSTVLVRL